MNTIQTPKEELLRLHRVLDIFRDLDQESREILLNFLSKKYLGGNDQ